MRHEAIYALYPNVTKIGDIAGAFDADGNKVEVDEDLVQAKIAELQAEYDAQEYARNRSSEYPTWQEAIEAVKTKYPKGE